MDIKDNWLGVFLRELQGIERKFIKQRKQLKDNKHNDSSDKFWV